jgi:hypothetical protein
LESRLHSSKWEEYFNSKLDSKPKGKYCLWHRRNFCNHACVCYLVNSGNHSHRNYFFYRTFIFRN